MWQSSADVPMARRGNNFAPLKMKCIEQISFRFSGEGLYSTQRCIEPAPLQADDDVALSCADYHVLLLLRSSVLAIAVEREKACSTRKNVVPVPRFNHVDNTTRLLALTGCNCRHQPTLVRTDAHENIAQSRHLPIFRHKMIPTWNVFVRSRNRHVAVALLFPPPITPPADASPATCL